MNHSELIGPDWFVSERCQSITSYYYDLLSPALQATLKEEIQRLKSKDDYVKFLQTDGAVIWDEFIKDISRHQKERSFSPLTESEAEIMFRALEKSFDSFGSPQKPKSKKIRSRHTRVRFSVAVFLLAAGFAVIAGTFFGLPMLSDYFQKQRTGEAEKTVEDNLAKVARYIEDEGDSKISSQLDSIEDSFNKIEGSMAKFNVSAEKLNQISSAAEKTQKKLAGQEAKLSNTSKELSQKVKALVTDITTVKPQIQKLESGIQGWSEPQNLLTEFKEIEEELVKHESDTSNLIRAFQNEWNPRNEDWEPSSRRSYGYLQINNGEADAIRNILRWNRGTSDDLNSSDRMNQLKRKLINLTQSDTRVIIDQEVTDSFAELTKQLLSVHENWLSLDENIAAVKSSVNDLREWKKHFEGLSTFTELTDETNEFFEQLAYASKIIGSSNNSYANRQRTVESIESIAASYDEIEKLQSELLFKGASPAVFLLLAIGGMFVTFGLSSILKWTKDIDEKDALETWARQNELYTMVSASLIQHGIDPTYIMSRLHHSFPTAAAEQAGVRFPVSETIAEIGKMIKNVK